MHRILLSILFTTSLFAKDIIAVLDLETIGLNPGEATILTQRLTTKLISIGKYEVVERTNMDKILKEQKFQKSGCTDSGCAVEIGQLLNTDFIVIGSVNKFGSTWTLDARLIDVGLGKGIISAEYSAEGKIDILLTTGLFSIAKQLCDIESSNDKDVKITNDDNSISIEEYKKLTGKTDNEIKHTNPQFNGSAGTFFYFVPALTINKKNDNGQITGTRGITLLLGYYSKKYFKPLKTDAWNPYWYWGTIYFILPMGGIGTQYVSDKGYFFDLGTLYLYPQISIGKFF